MSITSTSSSCREGHTALMVVDLQRYYIDDDAPFFRYYQERGADNYIKDRCTNVVIPNTVKLLEFFRSEQLPVIFLRLCGEEEDRSDLHHFFQQSHNRAKTNGTDGLYPLSSEPFADVVPECAPQDGELIVNKVTFSGFTSTSLEEELHQLGVERLVFCGLATSQCVDTTARDASDRGFHVIHVEDAQADYSEASHRAALYASQGVCGGAISDTATLLKSDYLKIFPQVM
ncbi:MAG: isochorismatase family cysteine hydrolase [Verrucomicrobiota bacterium]